MKVVGIYLGEEEALRLPKFYIAAAESIRAATFAAEVVLFAPVLAPLAAVVARATSLPALDEQVFQPGSLMPFPESTLDDGKDMSEAPTDPFVAVAAQYCRQHARVLFEQIRERKLPIDVFLTLSTPRSEPFLQLARDANTVLGFRRLHGPSELDTLDRTLLLDEHWTPSEITDPETGRADDIDEMLPPFGLLLQRMLNKPD